jgi:predicted porin
MTTKKLMLTGAALGLAAIAAQAQTTAATPITAKAEPGSGLVIRSGDSYAQLYGLIDITYVSKSHADTAGHSVVTPDAAWFSGNRWGLQGAHATKAAEGLKVIFKLESEFDPQTGNMDTPNVLFNRDAWVGVQGTSLGKLTFGRQNALGRDPAASGVYGDPYGPQKAGLDEGGYSNNNNFKHLIFYGGSATGTRMDRGVVWKKEWGNLVSGLAYQFGGVPGSFGKNTTKSASLAYNGPGFTLAGFVTRADVNNYKHGTESIGGNVQISPLVRINAGWFHYKAEQLAPFGDRKDTAWTVSTRIDPSGPFDYELGYQVMSATNAGTDGTYVKNAYADTSGIKGVATGKRKTLYGSAFYHLDKQTEFYLAADRLNTTGTYKSATAKGFMSQSTFGVGLRYKF